MLDGKEWHQITKRFSDEVEWRAEGETFTKIAVGAHDERTNNPSNVGYAALAFVRDMASLLVRRAKELEDLKQDVASLKNQVRWLEDKVFPDPPKKDGGP